MALHINPFYFLISLSLFLNAIKFVFATIRIKEELTESFKKYHEAEMTRIAKIENKTDWILNLRDLIQKKPKDIFSELYKIQVFTEQFSVLTTATAIAFMIATIIV